MHKLTYPRHYATSNAIITAGDWITLETRRYIDATETPGKHGYFGEVAE
jgi:hypothetical protein